MLLTAALIASAGLAAPISTFTAAAPEGQPPLAAFFGFDAMRTVVVDRGCGPVVVADFNADGRPDLAIVNNGKSRIELQLLRAQERTPEEMGKDLKVNQLPPSPWYDRQEISLSARVSALRAFDVDGDGRLDLIYAGQSPSEIVVMRQGEGTTFKVMARERVRGLSASQGGLRIADVMGDEAPEVITLAEDKVVAYPLGKDGVLGEPRRLPTDKPAGGLIVGDFNGDGLTDILAGVNDEQTPLRLWLQRQDPRVSGAKRGLLGSELRFDSPALRDVDFVQFPGRKAASLGVIERLSRRVVFYDFVNEDIAGETGKTASASNSSKPAQGEREVQAEAFGFQGGKDKDRAVAIIDVDGDGMLDLLATDTQNNQIVLYRQNQGVGLGDAESFSAFKAPKALAACAGKDWDGSATTKVFMLSEDEKAVGVADWNASTKKLGFPAPIAIKTAGATPATMEHVVLDGRGTLALVVKDKRDHTLELHQPGGGGSGGGAGGGGSEADAVTTVALKGVTRPPQSMIACDADQDGATDLLLFTPGEPMIMVRGDAADAAKKGKPQQVLTDKEMASFGLVQAAAPENTALFDADGDGKDELLIADKNFVRACRYDAKSGWKVISQVTVSDPGTSLVGLTVLDAGSNAGGGGKRIVASDKGNGRLLFLTPSEVQERLRLPGFTPSTIYAGAFGGDQQPGVLCLSDDAFALVRLAGTRLKMEQFAAYRSDSRDRSEYDVEFGDLNADGFVDAAVVDSGEQMCSILTFSASRKVQLATEFEMYESRLFSGGEGRELEPRDMMVIDCTGDGKDDLLLLIHDRVIVHPQAGKK